VALLIGVDEHIVKHEHLRAEVLRIDFPQRQPMNQLHLLFRA